MRASFTRAVVAVFSVAVVLRGPLAAQQQDNDTTAVRFAGAAGATLSGRIVLPDTGSQLPGVVLVHGSGPDDAASYGAYARAFARAGIATLAYDKRGSGASGGDWHHRPFALLAGDARAAMERLRHEARVDPSKVGLWGISQGTWVVAEAAQAEPQPAFVIAVAAAGVPPEQQELWHKENMLRALGYSDRARTIGARFWQLSFDFIERAASGGIPLPASLLEGERAGASTGLRYDALPAWQRVRVPVLLLAGARDELSPGDEARRLIRGALAAGGNRAVQATVFPGASHTITTRQVGLTFDWDTDFHPDYFPVMTSWITRVATGALPPLSESRAAMPRPALAFQPGGRWGHATWFGSAWPQLMLLVLLPAGLLVLLVVQLRSASGAPAPATSQGSPLAWGVTAAGGLALVAGFSAFVAQSLFAQGMVVRSTPYAIPAWQRGLPVLGSLVLVAALVALLTAARDALRTQVSLGLVARCGLAVLLVVWCLHWRLYGGPL